MIVMVCVLVMFLWLSWLMVVSVCGFRWVVCGVIICVRVWCCGWIWLIIVVLVVMLVLLRWCCGWFLVRCWMWCVLLCVVLWVMMLRWLWLVSCVCCCCRFLIVVL